MAHVRRKFYDIQVANGSAIASEAIQRIGALYDMSGRSAEIEKLSCHLYVIDLFVVEWF